MINVSCLAACVIAKPILLPSRRRGRASLAAERLDYWLTFASLRVLDEDTPESVQLLAQSCTDRSQKGRSSQHENCGTNSSNPSPSCGESVANFRRVLSRFVLEFGTGLYGCRPPLNLATQPAGRTTQNQSTPITKPTPEITTVEISQERHAG